MVKVIKAPQPLEINTGSVFLAGSIEMGKAVDWQTQLTNALAHRNITILNPRRDDWDSSWEQKIENKQFKQQVDWELEALRKANLVVFFFDPKTMSPISLLELGLMAATPMKQVIVCCPDGFWRKGNVDIVCKTYHLQMAENLNELIQMVAERVQAWD